MYLIGIFAHIHYSFYGKINNGKLIDYALIAFFVWKNSND